MARSSAFFDQVGDVTLLAMLLERVSQITNRKLDVDELLEKAEICFLKLVDYDGSQSDERLWSNLVALDNDSLDLTAMAEIARVYSLGCQGGPIYRCLETYARIKCSSVQASLQARGDEASLASLISLLFWLEMAGSNQVVGELLGQDSVRTFL